MTWPKAGHGDGAGESKGGKSAPGRAANSAYRSREHLTPEEVEALIRAARGIGRYGHRDATAILLAYRHGLRASELCELRREQVDLDRGELHVRRLKSGKPSTNPIPGDEMRALRKLLKDVQGPYVFATERGGPLDRSGFLKIVRRAGEAAGLPFPAHPHMLRHATGYYLANRGTDTRTIQDYLGHRNIQHTVRYTELAPGRFRGLWDRA
jgi:integrase